MDPEEMRRLNRAKIRRVDPTVNLAADGNDRWSESMNARDSSKVRQARLKQALLLAQNLCQ